MEILVLESQSGVSETAVDALSAAGHSVLRCHDPGAPAFPCRGLAPGSCPLDRGSVRVVLTTRGRTDPRPTPFEDGVTCALRRQLPVVAAGNPSGVAFVGFGVVEAGSRDIVTVCEAAANGRQVQHEAVANRVLDETLRRAGLAAVGDADVRRDAGGLQVMLTVPDETDARTRETAGVRVAGAVRAFDPHAARIDVGVAVADAEPD